MKKGLIGAAMITMACLWGLLAGLVILVFHLLGWGVMPAILGSIVVIIIQFLVSPFLTDLSMRWFYRAKFDPVLPSWLSSFIEQVCRDNNMKVPKIGYIDDGAPNAFTYGRTKNDARVVFTRGILERLNEEEVRSVIAHELGHAVHYDMLLMTAAQIVPLVMYAVYKACFAVSGSSSGSGSKSRKNSKEGGAVAVVGLVAYVLYIVCQYIILWFSRTREYYADEFSAETTRNPAALASALVRIGFGLGTAQNSEKKEKGISTAMPSAIGISDPNESKSVAILCGSDGTIDKAVIKNAMKWEKWNVWAKLYQLSSTHPLITYRIEALGELSEQYGQEPFVRFDLEKPESYADDFLKDLLILILPLLAFFAVAVVALCTTVRMPNGSPTSAVTSNPLLWIGIGIAAVSAASLLKFCYAHPNRKDAYRETNVAELLGEVKVSGITSIPAELEGKVIGRGNPGCVFNEDFVIEDRTGILFLDYKQPLFILNKLFAIFRNEQNFGKTVTVRGWYRRSPVPYMELYTYTVDGKIKKCFTYPFGIVLRCVGIVGGLILAALILL